MKIVVEAPWERDLTVNHCRMGPEKLAGIVRDLLRSEDYTQHESESLKALMGAPWDLYAELPWILGGEIPAKLRPWYPCLEVEDDSSIQAIVRGRGARGRSEGL